jgi:phage terminase large subunit
LAEVDKASKRVIIHESQLRGYAKVMGVDVARFGHHRSAIGRRWGPLWSPVLRWRGLDNMELALKVVHLAQEFKPDAIFIDAGRGEGVIDRCRQLGTEVIEIPFGGKSPNEHYANQRTFQWAAMAQAIRDVVVLPQPVDSELKTELSSAIYRMRGDKMELEPKEGDPLVNEQRSRPYKSPDLADACSLMYAAAVTPRQVDEELRRVVESAGQSFAQPEYVPDYAR